MCLWYVSSSKGYSPDRFWCLHGKKAGGRGEGKEQETFWSCVCTSTETQIWGLRRNQAFFPVTALAAGRMGGRLGEEQGVLFFPTSVAPSAQGSQGTQTAIQFLGFHFSPLPQVLGVLGVNLSVEKQVTPSLFKQKTSAGRALGCALGRGRGAGCRGSWRKRAPPRRG